MKGLQTSCPVHTEVGKVTNISGLVNVKGRCGKIHSPQLSPPSSRRDLLLWDSAALNKNLTTVSYAFYILTFQRFFLFVILWCSIKCNSSIKCIIFFSEKFPRFSCPSLISQSLLARKLNQKRIRKD